MSFISNIPTKVLFGCGMLDKLFEQKLPGTKALIVTTAGGSARRNGYLDKVTSGLDRNQIPYIVFDKIITNPEKAFIEEAANDMIPEK